MAASRSSDFDYKEQFPLERNNNKIKQQQFKLVCFKLKIKASLAGATLLPNVNRVTV